MDFVQAAAYFDRQEFDSYNFTTEAWELNTFKGQLKRSDDFITIWNRPTRKRMLYTAANVTIPSPVIRVPSTQEVYMVAHSFGDSHANSHYRTLRALHQSAGTALQYRKTPVENAGIKGWAVESLIATTFADTELRSVNEGQEAQLLNYGSFFVFTPSNTSLRRHDSLLLNGTRYYVIETYVDSGMICARATTTPDERVNFQYISIGNPVYNTATQSVSSTDTTYNTTGKITPLLMSEIKNSDITKARIRVQLLESFISYTPKVGDKVAYLSTTYTVEIVQRDAGLEEWVLQACL